MTISAQPIVADGPQAEFWVPLSPLAPVNHSPGARRASALRLT